MSWQCPVVCAPSPHSLPVLTPPNSTPLGPVTQRRSATYLGEHLATAGGEISFTTAPVIWRVSNEANFVTRTDEQPWGGLGSMALLLLVPALAVTPKLLQGFF